MSDSPGDVVGAAPEATETRVVVDEISRPDNDEKNNQGTSSDVVGDHDAAPSPTLRPEDDQPQRKTTPVNDVFSAPETSNTTSTDRSPSPGHIQNEGNTKSSSNSDTREEEEVKPEAHKETTTAEAPVCVTSAIAVTTTSGAAVSVTETVCSAEHPVVTPAAVSANPASTTALPVVSLNPPVTATPVVGAVNSVSTTSAPTSVSGGSVIGSKPGTHPQQPPTRGASALGFPTHPPLDKLAPVILLAKRELEEELRRVRGMHLDSCTEGMRSLLETLRARLAHAASSVQLLLNHVTAKVKAYEAYNAALTFQAPSTVSLGSMENVFDYFQRVSRTEVEMGSQFCRLINLEIGPVLKSYLTKINSTQQKINTKGVPTLTVLITNYDKVLKILQELEGSIDTLTHEGAQCTAVCKPESFHSLSRDPWLVQASVIHCTNAFFLSHSQLSSFLIAFSQETEAIETQVLSLVKNVVQRLMIQQSNMLGKVLTDIGIANQVVAALKDSRGHAVPESTTPKETTESETQITETRPYLSVFPATNYLRIRTVAKEGELECSGMFSWRKYHFVLTTYGFLHYFTYIQAPAPDDSIPLWACRLRFSAPANNLFQIDCTPAASSFFGSSVRSYQLRASDSDSAADWVLHLQKFVRS
ncbi:hypothetical protein Pelo_15194 [Pelomyxa schiedti]|nr:hypothetical protein Pelo_15194 [Pelomyxa schiedti]